MDIELCAASPEALKLAHLFSFKRVELCQNLENGGLTPSSALLELALSTSRFETHVLIRFRAGGFCYTEEEKELMLKEAYFALKKGAHGIVTGALTENRAPDINWLKELSRLKKNQELTFHRAFDDVISPEECLENLIELGFKRILSSGQKESAAAGIPLLRKLVKQASKRIEIMCGGGIDQTNVGEIIREVKPDALHFSGTNRKFRDQDSLFAATVLLPDEAKVKGIFNAIAGS